MRHLFLFIFSFFLSLNMALASSEEHGQDNSDDEHGEHQEGRAHIPRPMAQQVGITTAVAGPGAIAETLTVYGEVTTVPGNVSHVRARFPGLVTDVRATIGDHVQAGDVLAQVQSNESLNVYDLRSSITGVITERHANTGEFAADQVLFTVANLDKLWAELKVFPSQRLQVAPGQTVLVTTDQLNQETTLLHLVPGGDGQPFVIARAELTNRETSNNGQWAPGLLAKGEIHTGTTKAALVVDSRALQTLEGNTVVFIAEGDEFAARPVQTGRSDGRYTEILSDLETGERYAVENSYLIKADIEKSEASHAH
jgi:cobalt-zinc-cadmium efflux system membrane fusion protein